MHIKLWMIALDNVLVALTVGENMFLHIVADSGKTV